MEEWSLLSSQIEGSKPCGGNCLEFLSYVHLCVLRNIVLLANSKGEPFDETVGKCVKSSLPLVGLLDKQWDVLV